jgi:type IV pilus assembly protein PilO
MKRASGPAGIGSRIAKDPRLAMRVVVGVLVAANLAAAVAVFRPIGGSAEALRQRLTRLQAEVRRKEETLSRLRNLEATVEKARSETDRFLQDYFLDRRTAYSTLVEELTSLAEKAGVRPKGDSYVTEPVEGSQTLEMLVITAHYEGTYADLVHFVNLIDRSPRFLTIDSLQAAPQQATGTLNISLKLNAFVRKGEATP